MSDGITDARRGKYFSPKRYSNYKTDKSKKGIDLTKEEIEKIKFTKYKIIVPTKEDKHEIISAIKEFHDSDFDSDLVTPNQLAHEYINGNNIIVDAELFYKL